MVSTELRWGTEIKEVLYGLRCYKLTDSDLDGYHDFIFYCICGIEIRI